MREVLRTCGDAFPDLDQLADSYLVVHRLDDGDGKCPKCGGEIERIDVAGRSAQNCPRCQ